jgi:mono/diheme cytochrome c family protein
MIRSASIRSLSQRGRHRRRLALAAGIVAMVAGCRGQVSGDAPFHLIPDMDDQIKFKAQEENTFFADGRSMRPLVDGTLAQGHLNEDEGPVSGKYADGTYLVRIPGNVDEALLARGEERFNIFCSPCHDKTGSGAGLVIKRGYSLPVNLAADHAKGLKDGEVFDIVSNGVRNMPAYRAQIPVSDRWAIVAWVRVLQRSQAARIDDVPADKKNAIEPEMATP